MFTEKVTVKIKKDKKFVLYTRIIRQYDNSLSMVAIKNAMENDNVVFEFDPENNPIIHNGKDNSDYFLEEYFVKTLKLLKKAGANMTVMEGEEENLEFSKVSSSRDNVDLQIKKLHESEDGGVACGIADKLVKIAKKDETKRAAIINALMQYSIETPMDYLRSLLLTNINLIVKENESQYADFYKYKIEADEHLAAYYAIEGYVKVLQKESYDYLVSVLLSRELDMECNALIVCELSYLSNQPFDQGSPYEKRVWKESDLKLKEIVAWKNNGYPDGNGYETPATHKCLQEPETSAEKVYASLDKKLAKKREKTKDKAHPSNWLIIPNTDDVIRIKSNMSLPDYYMDFLEKASPLNVEVNLKGYGFVRLCGASNIIECQESYSYDFSKKQKLEGWPDNYVVIADSDADPFCIDCSMENSPVYYAIHDMGDWDFDVAFPSFIEFLKALK